MDTAKIHTISLPTSKCFDGIRVTFFSYSGGQGATAGARIRPVGGTWGPTTSVGAGAGTWAVMDVVFDLWDTDVGYQIDEFEIEVMNANGGNYLPFDNFQLWEST